MAALEVYKSTIDKIKSEFPDFEIIKKQDSKLMKMIDVALKIITLGKMKNFMTSFITTIKHKIYVPEDWDDYPLISRSIILRHELVHMRQNKRYGSLAFSILYLLIPFPTCIAYFRKKFEQEAYEESLRAIYEWNGEKALDSEKLKNITMSHFTTAEYFWMWPWKKNLENWYDSTVKKIKSGS